MFKFIVLVAFFGFAAAAVLDSDSKADFKIIEQDITPEGAFRYAFQTANGIDIKSAGNPDEIKGTFQYVSPEGKTITTTYIGNLDGFLAVGEHLPTPPPVPEAIIRSIEWNLAHPAKEVVLSRKL